MNKDDNTPLEVTCTVYFDMTRRAPKQELIDWLASLPDEATVTFGGYQSGKAQFTASWVEER